MTRNTPVRIVWKRSISHHHHISLRLGPGATNIYDMSEGPQGQLPSFIRIDESVSHKEKKKPLNKRMCLMRLVSVSLNKQVLGALVFNIVMD